MNILHTSDWHLGRTLYGRKRYEEFEAFLDWLYAAILEHGIDALLVAGDVFDTTTPSNRAQELYYRFLARIATSSCRHVVVIAGNHDSPTFLDAPGALLRSLQIHVVGSITNDPEDEVLVLRDRGGEPELIVCAVPYLRDRDIRVAEAGEGVEDKERKLLEGIGSHYAAVAAAAERKREELGGGVPVAAMGHLFTAGGEIIEGDGVRELYVGSLSHISAGMFPESFDYLALGHLHVPQRVDGSETMRYSGSPLPMGFGEAAQQKSVCVVGFRGTAAAVRQVPVPVFRKLERLRGDWNGLSERLQKLAAEGSDSWIEIVYEGEEVVGDLRERLDAAVAGTGMEILRIRNNRIIERVLQQAHVEETLDDLDADDVFQRCLDAHEIPEEQRAELLRTYRETLISLNDDDLRSE